MAIRMADINDIDLLTRLRLDYLAAEKVHMTEAEQEDIKQKFGAYLSRNMENGRFIAYAADEDGKTVSAAFLSIAERPPRIPFSSCLVGTVYNVYTDAAYRRRGIATQVIKALLEEAKAMDVASVELLATQDGKPLYEKLAFEVAPYTAMRLKL